MIRKFSLWVLASSSIIFGLCLFKNWKLYPNKSWSWRSIKSLFEAALIWTSGWYLPSLLVAWCVVWFTRGIKSIGVRVTLGVLCGALFGAVSGVALEVLWLLGVTAIEGVTGPDGFIGDLEKVIEDDRRRELARVA